MEDTYPKPKRYSKSYFDAWSIQEDVQGLRDYANELRIEHARSPDIFDLKSQKERLLGAFERMWENRRKQFEGIFQETFGKDFNSDEVQGILAPAFAEVEKGWMDLVGEGIKESEIPEMEVMYPEEGDFRKRYWLNDRLENAYSRDDINDLTDDNDHDFDAIIKPGKGRTQDDMEFKGNYGNPNSRFIDEDWLFPSLSPWMPQVKT